MRFLYLYVLETSNENWEGNANRSIQQAIDRLNDIKGVIFCTCFLPIVRIFLLDDVTSIFCRNECRESGLLYKFSSFEDLLLF